MMPSQIFLNATDSIRDRSWKTTSWKVITWSLKQLGLAGTASKHHPLRESHMILLENLEVRRTRSASRSPSNMGEILVGKSKGAECLIFSSRQSRASTAHEDV